VPCSPVDPERSLCFLPPSAQIPQWVPREITHDFLEYPD
jgi:hypothetical protein